MKPNPTSVLEHLPKGTSFYKHNMSEVLYRLRLKDIVGITRENSKVIADEYLLMLEEQKQKAKQDKINYKRISKLYRICIPYKVDCYHACCRFIEYKFCEFVLTPDRLPTVPYKEEQGYWYNHIMKTTGYFKGSCGDWCEKTGNHNHQLYILENLLYEFKQFIKENHKILNKYRKRKYIDYSHLAYNGVTDDF